ncbi:hypothetical protein CMV_028398 [Castanea mollissima]|uniref:ABC transporter domain-containing protein n=1 Tax=Castanea mollissima TaxID=60419 RepID=A0A8J4QDW7_9ROSI|nr:hypothetical protein CMV_028398 [Castanea mollissima]
MAAAAFAGDDLSRQSSSRRSWRSTSVREMWHEPDVFQRSGRQVVNDEEELKWAAIERLPTYDRVRTGMLKQVMSNGRVVHGEVDVTNLGSQDKKQLMESILKVVEEDNEKFLRRLRNRTDRVGIEIPKIEVRIQNLSVEGDAYIGTRALPTLLNSSMNAIESALEMIGLSPSKKKVVKILQDVSGIVRSSRMTLLLGPPGSGKTTLLQGLAGKLGDDLRVTGKVTYCGHEFKEFVPQRTCAYISQHDLHYGEMTVRETLDFSGRCLGVGTRYEMLLELSRREKEAGIKPDPEIDAFMKATAMAGQETSLITDYVLKILGLDICADTMVGDDMRRGISGGQKKRVTTGEMLVGPAKAFFMDEISTGLDSSTTFQIVRFMRQMVHIMDVTMVISLLQPAPETFDLFDDIILLSEGQIVYQVSLLESGIWIILTYYTIGFAPSPSRFFKQFLAFFGIHQMALSLFRFIAAVGRTQVVANTLGIFTLLLVFVLGGFIVSKDDIQPWMIWGYYISPMMYGQNAIAINEFLDDRWSAPVNTGEGTVGKTLLAERGLYTEERWYWICVAALFGFSLLFNVLFIAALTFLNPLGETKAVIVEDVSESNPRRQLTSNSEGNRNAQGTSSVQSNRGMVLPFQPLSLAFNHVNYYVDMPAEMKTQGVDETRLQLLRDVSGAFKPGVLTALVGVSGAGKTTLMDVLAGRKTGGYIEGSISISGYPKNQATFARVSGYCEQNDIHSPYVTVYESLVYSAWLRLASDVKKETRKMFVDEVMDLVELHPLRDALVGLPGVDGLSTEQRKRLTIAVELVANPSIIFMDEPTSGLDARAAAIVMRTVRNTVDTGRTVVCTIHQPSIDIFEAFDELFLMKRGGQVIYAGPLGRRSHKLVEYFEAIQGVPKIKEGYNPATWMLDVTSTAVEGQLDIDFAEVYANSDLYRRNQELIKNLSTPEPGSNDLYFPTQYSQSFTTQCKACFWKQHWSYWRNSKYNAIRFFSTTVIGILFGIIFWGKGDKIHKQQDLVNLLGATYAAVLFLGGTNASAVQSVVSVERTVFYRERAAGMYSELPYAFAQVAIETIYVAIQTFVYSVLLYSMIGFSWQLDKFLYFYYFIFMCFTYFSMYGMMVVALTPGHQIAAIVMSFFLSFWNLFSGFLIPRPLIPIWWRWYYWASPVAWTIYGVFASQFGDLKTDIEITLGTPQPIDTFLKTVLGYDHDFLVPVVIAHVAWVLLFFFVFAYGIKFLNFQRR